MTCTSYCEKIEEIFDAMIRLVDEVLPENRKEVIEYLSNVWGRVMVWVGSVIRGWRTREIEDRFDSYVIAEEAKLHRDLERIKYDIDSLNTVRLISGNSRTETVIIQILSLYFSELISEKFLLPMLYLVLKRDLEKISLARKHVLSDSELPDAVETIGSVSQAALDRSESLQGKPQMLPGSRFYLTVFSSHLRTPGSRRQGTIQSLREWPGVCSCCLAAT